MTRVRGRTAFGADCPKRSLAREASTLSLATCLPGIPGVVLIPLGRLSTSPRPLLARVALGFHHLHRRAGCIHARRLRESIKAVAIADSPVATHHAAETTPRASKSDAGGLGGYALDRVLPREEFMGRAFSNAYRSMPSSLALQACGKRLPRHRLNSRRRLIQRWSMKWWRSARSLSQFRLLADLHHSRAARIRVAGGGAGGDAPDAPGFGSGASPRSGPATQASFPIMGYNKSRWSSARSLEIQARRWSPLWRDFLRCGGQARTVSPVDATAVIGSQLTSCVEVAAELLADVEQQTVRSVHQAQRPG